MPIQANPYPNIDGIGNVSSSFPLGSDPPYPILRPSTSWTTLQEYLLYATFETTPKVGLCTSTRSAGLPHHLPPFKFLPDHVLGVDNLERWTHLKLESLVTPNPPILLPTDLSAAYQIFQQEHRSFHSLRGDEANFSDPSWQACKLVKRAVESVDAFQSSGSVVINRERSFYGMKMDISLELNEKPITCVELKQWAAGQTLFGELEKLAFAENDAGVVIGTNLAQLASGNSAAAALIKLGSFFAQDLATATEGAVRHGFLTDLFNVVHCVVLPNGPSPTLLISRPFPVNSQAPSLSSLLHFAILSKDITVQDFGLPPGVTLPPPRAPSPTGSRSGVDRGNGNVDGRGSTDDTGSGGNGNESRGGGRGSSGRSQSVSGGEGGADVESDDEDLPAPWEWLWGVGYNSSRSPEHPQAAIQLDQIIKAIQVIEEIPGSQRRHHVLHSTDATTLVSPPDTSRTTMFPRPQLQPSFPLPTLNLHARPTIGEFGAVYKVSGEELVLKYPLASNKGLDELQQEWWIYENHLKTTSIAPKCYGLFTNGCWSALVLQWGGHSLSNFSELDFDSRRSLLELLENLHKAGLTHGDFKPSNILHDGRRFYLVDFANAEAHNCDGSTCAELQRARIMLRL